MKSLKLRRRTFLRGAGVAGVAIGLPVLDAMLDTRGLLHGTARSQAAEPPKRLIMFQFPNGTAMSEWTPQETGTNYALSPALMAMERYKDRMLVLSGLSNLGAIDGFGAGHENGRLCFATAVPPSADGMTGGGPSLEVVAGQKLGQTTKFPNLAIAPGPMQGGTTSYLSWIAKDQPMPYEHANAQLFDKLFMDVAVDPEAQARAEVIRAKRQSVLDFVKEDVTRLEAKLGSSDRLRLQAHLDSVREIERRIARSGATEACTMPSRPAETDPEDWLYGGTPIEDVRIQFDLIGAALRCDLTRHVMFVLHTNTSYWIGEQFGDMRGHHEISHDDSRRDIQIAYTNYQLGILAELLDRLDVAEGDSTILDNSLVYVSSEVAWGTAHNFDKLPVLLLGSAGGRIATGRHIDYGRIANYKYDRKDWVDLSRLFLTILHALGATDVTSWGTATEPLDLTSV